MGWNRLPLAQYVSAPTLSRQPRLQRQPGGIPAVEELQTLPPGRAHPSPTSHKGIPREEGRLDRQNIIARDVVRRIGALKNELQVRRVRVSMVRHAESSAGFQKLSNAKLESEMLLRFEKAMIIKAMNINAYNSLPPRYRSNRAGRRGTLDDDPGCGPATAIRWPRAPATHRREDAPCANARRCPARCRTRRDPVSAHGPGI
jgi:hypothetical protein